MVISKSHKPRVVPAHLAGALENPPLRAKGWAR